MLRLLLLLSLLGLLSLASACPVKYRGDGLLFGGVGDRCTSGCQKRTSEVARTCGFRGQQDDVWGLCTPEQRNNNIRELERPDACVETTRGGTDH